MAVESDGVGVSQWVGTRAWKCTWHHEEGLLWGSKLVSSYSHRFRGLGWLPVWFLLQKGRERAEGP